MISSAKEVLREQQFARLVPMKELTRDPKLQADLEDEEVFVQGSIDLLLSTDKGWILVDYKTTAPRNVPGVKERYAVQMDIYRRAIEEATGYEIGESYLYLTNLGLTVDMM